MNLSKVISNITGSSNKFHSIRLIQIPKLKNEYFGSVYYWDKIWLVNKKKKTNINHIDEIDISLEKKEKKV